MAVKQGAKSNSVASAQRFYALAVEDLHPLNNCEFGEPGVADLLVFIVPVDGHHAIAIDEVRIGLEFVRKAA